MTSQADTPRTAPTEDSLDAMARLLVQMLLRVQFREDAAEILSDGLGGARRRKHRMIQLRCRYRALGLADVSLGEVGHVGRARGESGGG